MLQLLPVKAIAVLGIPYRRKGKCSAAGWHCIKPRRKAYHLLRRYVYWRLLSTDPEAAKDVVLAEKPVIADNSSALEPSLLQQLLHDLSTLASVR